MIRRALVLASAGVAVLALGAPAQAKELTRVTICGLRDRCAVITDREQLRLVPLGGSTSVAAPPLQPFYWMTFTIQHGDDALEDEVGSFYYLREADLLGANHADPGRLTWLPIGDPRSARLLRDATRGIEPHQAPPAWPRELKSPYRVIPDDELVAPQPSYTARPWAPPREQGPSALWLVAAIVMGLAAAALLLRRLATHQARNQPA
jgi:hypothetical protein